MRWLRNIKLYRVSFKKFFVKLVSVLLPHTTHNSETIMLLHKFAAQS